MSVSHNAQPSTKELDVDLTKEIQQALAQLILLNGMLTDANVPGCEKVTVTMVQKNWLQSPSVAFKNKEDLNFDDRLAPPLAIFMVKGWNRAICGLTVLFAMFENPSLLEAGTLRLTIILFDVICSIGKATPDNVTKCLPWIHFFPT